MKCHALLKGIFLLAILPASAAIAAAPQAPGKPIVSWPSGNALKTMVAKSKQTVEATFQSDGVGATIESVRNCYAHMKRLDWGAAQARCVTLDIAAYTHEYFVSTEFRKLDFENDSYLTPHEFHLRMLKYLPPSTGAERDKKPYLETILHIYNDA